MNMWSTKFRSKLHKWCKILKKKQKYGTKGAPTSLSNGRSKVWAFKNGINVREIAENILHKNFEECYFIGSGNKILQEQSGKPEVRS